MIPAEQKSALERILSGNLRREHGYVEIPTEALVPKVDVKMPPLPSIAFYIIKDGKFELLRRPDQAYSALALSMHPVIWVSEADLKQFRHFAENALLDPEALKDLPPEEKMTTLRKTAISVVEDMFEDPSPENVSKGVKVVGSFVYTLMKEPKSYLFLARLSSHDPYTLQHSVGCSVNAIILARKVGITDENELLEVGLAGLLHDIGKVKVRKEIINKPGPLDPQEWEEMRRHSAEGYELVKTYPFLTERTKRAIIEHHEEKKGTGYPLGLKEEEIHLFSKIICLCDIFNALTTNRSYSKARTPFEAFELMRDKMMHKIDDKLFKELVKVYGGQIPD